MYSRIYIHVPFCAEKCHYCAFISGRPERNDLAEYPALLMRELELGFRTTAPINSIYFGGGTPSLLPPPQIKEIIDRIATRTTVLADAEITLEANPGTVSSGSMADFHAAGVNRISLGAQSFSNHFLECLGRIHTAEHSCQAFKDAREAGFNNVSIDLIHSLPGQSIDQWRSELQHAVQLSPEHISIYGLTVEEGTTFAHIYPADSPELADADLSADMFELADELLGESGFEHYEIANYARPGRRSQHNSGYWHRDGYLGLGVAAHSFLRDGYGVRFSNSDNLEEYRHGVLSGQLKRIGEQQLTRNEAMAEYMFLGLRLSDGVAPHDFEREFGRSLDSVYGSAMTDLVRIGLLLRTEGAYTLTRRGMQLSNQVFTRFLQ